MGLTAIMAGTICLPNGTTVNQHQIMVTALDGDQATQWYLVSKLINRYLVIKLSDVDQGANSIFLIMLPGGTQSSVFGPVSILVLPQYSNGISWPVGALQRWKQ
jgi:hypothetical protein